MYKASNTFSGIYLTPYKYSLLLFTLPVKFSDSLVHIYVRRREAPFSLQLGPVCFFWFQGEAWLWGRWGVIQRRRWMMMSLRSSLGGWTPQGDMSLITPFVSLFFFFSFCFGFTCHSCLIWGLVVGVRGLFQGSNWSLLWEGMNRCDHFSSDSVGCFEFWFRGYGVEWFGVCLQLGPETLYLSPVFLFSSSFYERTRMFYLFPSFLRCARCLNGLVSLGFVVS